MANCEHPVKGVSLPGGTIYSTQTLRVYLLMVLQITCFPNLVSVKRNNLPMDPGSLLHVSCSSQNSGSELKRDLLKVLKGSNKCDNDRIVPNPDIKELAGLLQKHNHLPHPGMLSWGLDHRYSNEHFLNNGVPALKGVDKIVYSCLHSANLLIEEEKKYDFFVVDTRRQKKVYETINIYGKKWHGPLEFILDDITIFNKINSSNCSNAVCGNGGTTNTTWYFFLVVVPKTNIGRILFKDSVKSGVNYLAKQLECDNSSSLTKLARDILDVSAKHRRGFCKSENIVAAMFRVVLVIQELDLAKNLILLLFEDLTCTSSTNFHYPDKSNIIFGISSMEMVGLLNDAISAFGWQALEEELTKLVKHCPPQYYQFAIMFLEQSVPTDVSENLIIAIVEKAVNSGGKEANLSQNNVIGICSVFYNHPESLNEFVEPFLNLKEVQNIPMLIKILMIGKEREHEKSLFYQMTLSLLDVKLLKMPSDKGRKMSAEEIGEVVLAVEYLLDSEENTLVDKFLREVLRMKSLTKLWKALLSNDRICQSAIANEMEPIKWLMKAQITRLHLIICDGEPQFSWSLPNAVIPGHPEVQAFLQGPERTFMYRKFKARSQAEMFKNMYFARNGKVSALVKGRGRDTEVMIFKTQANIIKHNGDVNEYTENCKELKRLQEYRFALDNQKLSST